KYHLLLSSAAVRAEIEVLRNERLAYEQEGIQTREALTRSEAHCKALEARVAVLWRLEYAMTPWRTLVAVPRFDYDCKINAECYRARYREEVDGMQHFEDLDKRKFG
nr:hypothetical protein [Tanacetum cinerariifolium]